MCKSCIDVLYKQYDELYGEFAKTPLDFEERLVDIAFKLEVLVHRIISNIREATGLQVVEYHLLDAYPNLQRIYDTIEDTMFNWCAYVRKAGPTC